MTAADTARNESETTGPTSPIVHFPGFESLRALAAVMVVVHHAVALSGASRAGRLATPAAVMDSGVAVFFVISGLLIYRPFAVAHLGGRPAPGAAGFWWRRLLRIVPAYWLVLTFFWALGSFHLGHDWWRYYLFLQIYSVTTVLGGIVQAWSLCTEISFYVFIPCWAWAIGRAAARQPSRRGRFAVEMGGIAALFVSAYAARAAMDLWAPSHRNLGFMWLPTNLDLFATGMALATLSAWAVESPATKARLDHWARSVAPWWLAAVGLFTWYAYVIGPAPFLTGYGGLFWHRRQFVLSLFTALLLVPALFGDQRAGLVRRVWSWRPLVWVGTVSYGLYLWHFDWMKAAVGRDDLGGSWPGWLNAPAGDASVVALLAVGLGVGLLFAAVSWYVVEEPLGELKGLIGRVTRSARPTR